MFHACALIRMEFNSLMSLARNRSDAQRCTYDATYFIYLMSSIKHFKILTTLNQLNIILNVGGGSEWQLSLKVAELGIRILQFVVETS